MDFELVDRARGLLSDAGEAPTMKKGRTTSLSSRKSCGQGKVIKRLLQKGKLLLSQREEQGSPVV